MGRAGALLREKKKQNTVYTFTREQLEARDRSLLEAHKESMVQKIRLQQEADRARYEKEFNERIAEEWKSRERKFYSDNTVAPFTLLQYMTAVAVDVLCEDFGWAPVRFVKKVNQRQKLVRFVNGVVQRFNDISADQNKDILKFADAAYEKWGVRFTLPGKEEEDGKVLEESN